MFIKTILASALLGLVMAGVNTDPASSSIATSAAENPSQNQNATELKEGEAVPATQAAAEGEQGETKKESADGSEAKTESSEEVEVDSQ